MAYRNSARRGYGSRGRSRSTRRNVSARSYSRGRSRSFNGSRRGTRDVRLVIEQVAPQPALSAAEFAGAGRLRLQKDAGRSTF